MKYISVISICIGTAVLMLGGEALATTYYVDATNGNDFNTGLSDAQAWKTVGKVNGFPFSTGDDVYFKAGETWAGVQLTVDWAGVTGNRAVIGSYYMSGSETVGIPSGTNKPIIKGTYIKAGDAFDTAGAVPSGLYAGLVQVEQDYVTIQDIEISNSAGAGIRLISTVASPHHYNLIDNVTIFYSAMGNVNWGRGSTYNIMRNSDSSWCSMANYNGDKSPPHTSCNVGVNSNYNIIENNYVHENYGEGIAFYLGSAYNIIRNNVTAATRSTDIYLDNAHTNIIEGNMIVGGLPDSPWPTRNGSISITVEDYSVLTDTINNVIRNNLIVNVGTPTLYECIAADMEPAAKAAGKQVGFSAFNNTCVGGSFRVSPLAANTGTIEIANNVFAYVNTECRSNSTDVNVHHNHWDTNPIDAECDGTGDLYGDPLLNRTDWSGLSLQNLPSISDFDLAAGSPAINTGQAQVATVYTSEFPQASSLQSGCALDLTESTKDYFDIDTAVGCNTRSDPPDMGAFEMGIQTVDSNVTVPFYMNVGGGQLNLSKTYLAEGYASGSGTYTNTSTIAVEGTTDDTVYQSWRGNNGTITWSIPIANGNYDLTLLYQESYWGVAAGSCTAAGSNRQFDVSVEGVLVHDEFDICALAGAPLTAVRDVIQNVIVSDGQMDIELSLGKGQDPKPVLMGLEITVAAPAPSAPSNLIVR